MTDEAPTRITVTLIRKSVDDLDHEVTDSGMSKTDVVNRAIQLYRFIQDQTRAGKELLLRDQDGEGERVHLI